MARTLEYIKRSEARIIVYLETTENYLKCGKKIAEKLDIDYIYVMKLLTAMYEKGWLYTHKYNYSDYFRLSEKCPLDMAKEILSNPQAKLRLDNGTSQEDDNRQV